jgi:mlo protein
MMLINVIFICSLLIKMGSSFNKAIFDDNVSEDLANWAQSARSHNKKNKTNVDAANSSTYERHGGVVQMTNA